MLTNNSNQRCEAIHFISSSFSLECGVRIAPSTRLLPGPDGRIVRNISRSFCIAKSKREGEPTDDDDEEEEKEGNGDGVT